MSPHTVKRGCGGLPGPSHDARALAVNIFCGSPAKEGDLCVFVSRGMCVAIPASCPGCAKFPNGCVPQTEAERSRLRNAPNAFHKRVRSTNGCVPQTGLLLMGYPHCSGTPKNCFGIPENCSIKQKRKGPPPARGTHQKGTARGAACMTGGARVPATTFHSMRGWSSFTQLVLLHN